MKKFIDSIKYLKLSDIVAPFEFLITYIISIVIKLKNKVNKRRVWLICENGTSARDNGYHFFKYMCENHKEIECYYVIDTKSKDYEKIKKYNNIISYKSLKHWIYYLSAEYNISNHKNGNPNPPLFYVLHVSLGLFNNRVFLQHGITKDDAKWLYYNVTKFRYFVCGAKREYEFIKKTFGYPSENVIYTGFPRFDNLDNKSVNEKQILIMPTWRNWLGRETNSLGKQQDFTTTDFYKNWNELLSNERFRKYINENEYNVKFYPHINMQKYINCFRNDFNKLEILSSDDIDIQDLLKESAILITDYSSVYMDFAYMRKPVLYYQFDYKEYREKQYQDGYFDYIKDGFGPVAYNVDKLIDLLVDILENGLNQEYYNRMNSFFEIKDESNSERIYKILKGEK